MIYFSLHTVRMSLLQHCLTDGYLGSKTPNTWKHLTNSFKDFYIFEIRLLLLILSQTVTSNQLFQSEVTSNNSILLILFLLILVHLEGYRLQLDTCNSLNKRALSLDHSWGI